MDFVVRTIYSPILARIKEVVGWCLDNDLKVIINAHHEKWLESRPYYANQDENCKKLGFLWKNIASALANYDSRLAFAGTNEVHVRDNWSKPTVENLEVQNAYNQTFVDMVRATGGNNAKRHLILQTYVCNPWFGIENGDFIIPKDAEGNGNNYMSVEFHSMLEDTIVFAATGISALLLIITRLCFALLMVWGRRIAKTAI